MQQPATALHREQFQSGPSNESCRQLLSRSQTKGRKLNAYRFQSSRGPRGNHVSASVFRRRSNGVVDKDGQPERTSAGWAARGGSTTTLRNACLMQISRDCISAFISCSLIRQPRARVVTPRGLRRWLRETQERAERTRLRPLRHCVVAPQYAPLPGVAPSPIVTIHAPYRIQEYGAVTQRTSPTQEPPREARKATSLRQHVRSDGAVIRQDHRASDRRGRKRRLAHRNRHRHAPLVSDQNLPAGSASTPVR